MIFKNLRFQLLFVLMTTGLFAQNYQTWTSPESPSLSEPFTVYFESIQTDANFNTPSSQSLYMIASLKGSSATLTTSNGNPIILWDVKSPILGTTPSDLNNIFNTSIEFQRSTDAQFSGRVVWEAEFTSCDYFTKESFQPFYDKQNSYGYDLQPKVESMKVRFVNSNYSNADGGIDVSSNASNELTLDLADESPLQVKSVTVNDTYEYNLGDNITNLPTTFDDGSFINITSSNPSVIGIDSNLGSKSFHIFSEGTTTITYSSETSCFKTKSVQVTVNNPNTHTVYVRRENYAYYSLPKVHAWYKDESGVEHGLTDWNNPPTTSLYGYDGWSKYVVEANNYGILFRYNDKQTEDFKFYSEDKWILLDASGNLISITNYNPDESNENDVIIAYSPQENANGKFDEGTNVTVTLARSTSCSGCAISTYYTLDGSDPRTSATAQVYTSPFYVNSDTTVKAVSKDGYGFYSVSEKTFLFETNFFYHTVHVKREGHSSAPNVHAWYKDANGNDQGITDWNFPPSALPAGNDWFQYVIYENNYGILFRYLGDVQTQDFKYYSKDIWIVLDVNGNPVSVTDYDPENAEYDVIIAYSPQENTNGKFDEGTNVTVTLARSTSCGGCAISTYYTLDGTDPRTSATAQVYTSPFYVNSDTTVKAVSKDGYGFYSVSEKEFIFEGSTNYRKVYVKRQGSTELPKVHAWISLNYGNEQGLTDWNNPPSTVATEDGWSEFEITENGYDYGILFRYNDKQTEDFKFYSEGKWILLDTNGDLISVTNTKPVENTGHTVYVKRENSLETPRVHAWYKDANDVEHGLTDWNSSPNALPTTNNGWYKYEIGQDNYGILFKFNDKQTQDFKFYSQDIWVLLDASGNLIDVYYSDASNLRKADATSIVTTKSYVAPNPARDFFKVSKKVNGTQNVEITIVDLTGNVVYLNSEIATDLFEKTYTVSQCNLNKGIYLLNITVGSDSETSKLIVE
ncbi:MAG: chitobiase/beta-hexosaminidase C-terminal domain-containing protein [Flavobacteriales bacterium]|nr:chitobiase/beta-hexosaminidase C-terminal domain-containing protein [Flavobacteriales bacterium]